MTQNNALMDPINSVDDKIILNMDACFTAFDNDGDGLLSLAEFAVLCRALFRNDKGHIYTVPDDQIDNMFSVFDKNQDGFIDRDEFSFCWHHWIKTIMRPISAFLIVDVQNDFISGSLAISNCAAQHNGNDIIQPINRILYSIDFSKVIYSLDWHPSDHISFIDNVKMHPLHESSPVDADTAKPFDIAIFDGNPPIKQRLWPRHCIQDSWGAQLHKDLKILDDSVKVYKGSDPLVDSYSVFSDNEKMSKTILGAEMRAQGITDVYVCGIAYDVCVGATAADALASGYRTILIDDCCRGIDLKDIEKTKKTIESAHGIIIESKQIKAMVEGRDRRPELGFKLAIELNDKKSDLFQRISGKHSV